MNDSGQEGVVCYQPEDDCVTIRGMNGYGVVLGKWGCCRGRNWVNPGGQDHRGRNNRML